MSNRLANKVAIVTGGASGIGMEIAKGCAAEGARVCVADLSPEKCATLAASIGAGAFGHALDVRQRGSIDALIAGVVATAGGIDILINSAGVFGMQMLVDLTEAEFDRILGVNARGMLFVTQAVARQMIKQKRGGAIVSIASGVARRPSPGAISYSASKAAVVSITQAAAQELIAHGIRVNAIAPGPVLTPMWEGVEKEFAVVMGTTPEAMRAAQSASTAIGRMSTPEEYVGAAIYLASAESSYVVGQTLNIDGGLNFN